MAENTDNPEKLDGDEEILRIARERFKIAEEAWSEVYKAADEDLEFLAGNQWPEKIKQDRDSKDRPCLTINKISSTLKQVVNDQRQNRPAIKLSPVDDKADIETAKILQGVIRSIERNSHADVAYDTAFEGAAGPSFGFFRILTEYSDPMSFDQEIKIKQIPNQFLCYLDPFFKEPDGSDANYGFIFEDVPEDDYDSEYGEGDTKLGKSISWEDAGSQAPGWINGKTCRIAEYICKEYKEAEIFQLPDGQTMMMDDLSDEQKSTVKNNPKAFPTRKTKIPVIKWYKMNGVEILERTELPGRFIPIIPVLGNKLIVKGKVVLEGMIRHAKDPQRMYNYWASTETETIALAPKAPFIVEERQIENYKKQWATANSESHAYLPYTAVAINGSPVAPPQRNVYEPPVQAITNARLQSSEDLKATTGVYDAALGARSNETSGIAIQGRQRQAQTSNFHFVDNLTRSIRHCGRILVDWIPVIYDTKRALRMIGEEGNEEVIQIHDELFKYKGENKLIDFSIGKYDVSVETGPSYATKRQEAAAAMVELTSKYPQIMQIAGDLMVQNMDIPGASEIAERMKKTIDPKLIDSKDQKPIPPEIQAQMQQMSQMIEQLTEKLNESNETIKTKKMELESKERIEAMKNQTSLTIEQIKLQGEAANAVYLAELESIKQRLALLDFNQPINDDFENDFNEQVSDQDPALEQQQPTDGLSSGQPMGV